MACGVEWTSDDLYDRGFVPLHVVPLLPHRWPHCPECLCPLNRIDDGQRWICRDHDAWQVSVTAEELEQ